MNRFWKAVWIATLVAGTLDIAAAHVNQLIRTGAFPARIFNFIAGGATGLEKALSGGVAVVVLGVLIHYFISFSFTLLFFVMYPVIVRISRNKYVNGILYGAIVWAVMNLIVLPYSALPAKPFVFNSQAVIGLLILMVVFGPPVSLLAGRYYKHLTSK